MHPIILCKCFSSLRGLMSATPSLLYQLHFLSTDQSNCQMIKSTCNHFLGLAGAVTVATAAPHMPPFAPRYCCIPLFPTQTARYCLGIMPLLRRGGFGLIPAAEQKILLLQLLGWRSKARANLLNSWIYSGKRWEGALQSSAGDLVRMMISNQWAENSAQVDGLIKNTTANQQSGFFFL